MRAGPLQPLFAQVPSSEEKRTGVPPSERAWLVRRGALEKATRALAPACFGLREVQGRVCTDVHRRPAGGTGVQISGEIPRDQLKQIKPSPAPGLRSTPKTFSNFLTLQFYFSCEPL